MIKRFKARSPMAAGIIAFLTGPVVGMCYLSRGKMALAYLLAAAALFGIPFVIAHYAPWMPHPLSVAWTFWFLIYWLGLFHCIKAAEDYAPEQSPKWYARWISLVIWVLSPWLLIWVILSFIFQFFWIPANSMAPNIQAGDHLFVEKYAYGYNQHSPGLTWFLGPDRIWPKPPQRGDIVVFKVPADNNRIYIKRIIGLPGERIRLEQNVVYINDEPIARQADGVFEYSERGRAARLSQYIETLPNGRSYPIIIEDASTPNSANMREETVPEQRYFVMGDNRDNSMDSRFIDAIPEAHIIGRVGLVYWNSLTYKLSYRWPSKPQNP